MKLNKVTILIIIIIILFICGCEDPTSGVRFDADVYYTLTGKLRAGQAVDYHDPVFIGKAVDADGGNFLEGFENDADVKIYDVTDPDNEYACCNLYFMSNAQIAETGLVGYYDYYHALLPIPGHTYRVRAIIYNDELERRDTIWAETTIPSPVEIVEDGVFTTSIPQTDNDFPELSWATANTQHPLRVATENGIEHKLYYIFDCLEDYNWQTTRKTNPTYGESEYPEDYDDYSDYDNLDYAYFYMPSYNEGSGQFEITDRSYKNNLYFFGRYAITICTIDDNYFTYLNLEEGFMFGGVHATNPNVKAFGYLGSLSGQTAYTRVID